MVVEFMMHYLLSRELGRIKTIGTSIHAKKNVKMRPAHLHPGYARKIQQGK
jgi:hypothetical protein